MHSSLPLVSRLDFNDDIGIGGDLSARKNRSQLRASACALAVPIRLESASGANRLTTHKEERSLPESERHRYLWEDHVWWLDGGFWGFFRVEKAN